MAAYDPKEDDYGDGDIPEVDTEPYKDGFYVSFMATGRFV